MPGLISDTLAQTNPWDDMAGLAPSSVWDRVDPLGLSNQVARAIGNSQAQFGTVDEYGRQMSAPEAPVDHEVLNRRYGVQDTARTGVSPLQFNGPLPESVAASMHQAKLDEVARAEASQRQPDGVGSTAANFAVGMLDPLGIAASFVPVIPEARMAGMLARGGEDIMGSVLGRTAVRAATGAVAGGAAQVPLIGVRYALSQQEHADYTMSDAMADLVMGTVLGGGLHVATGFAGDMVGRAFGRTRAFATAEADPVARENALRAGVAGLVEDRPNEAGLLLDHADLIAEHDRLQTEWLTHSYDSDALAREIAAVPDPTKPDEITQQRLNSITEELQQAGLTAQRKSALLDEQRMLTEGAADPDALELARSASQREGLQAAILRNEQRMAEIDAQLRNSEGVARARGALDPLDVDAISRADEAWHPTASPVLDDLQSRITQMETELRNAPIDGETGEPTKLPAERQAALDGIQDAQAADRSFGSALKQAAACMMKGLS